MSKSRQFLCLFLRVLLLIVTVQSASATYQNPLFTSNTPDPWVVYTNGYYYHTRTTGGNIRIYRALTLQGLANSSVATVFSPNGEILSDIWAPELHYLDGKWYIYSTGNIATNGSAMRMFVLEGNSQNPQGTYAYKGIITNLNAIDATVLVRPSDSAKFLVWSQFDSFGQSLYAASMSNPWTLSSRGVRISSPTYPWEKNGNVNEGPQIVQRNGKTFIIYSASGTWTPYYCLGLLSNTDGNYTNAASWKKFSNPVFQPSVVNSTYCVGHCSFTKSPSGTEDWLVYHGTSDPLDPQISRRYTRIQPFWWNSDDTPNFDVPTAAGVLLLGPDEAPGKPSQGLRAEYFTNSSLSGTATFATNYTMNFNWGAGAPLLSIGTNQFSARWTGKIYAPSTGAYTFHTVQDDGARLWVNGQPLINDWQPNSLKTNSANITLAGNAVYDIHLEYFEQTGNAVAGLRWTPPGGTTETIPGSCLFPFTNGLFAEYFRDTNLNQRVLSRLDPHVNFSWSNSIAGLGVPADRFSVRWTGRVQPKYSEMYTFRINSANGRRLWVNNQLLIDRWIDNANVEYAGNIALQAGQKYDLRLEYFGNVGPAQCKLSWSSAQQAQEIIPQSQLFPPFNQPPVLSPVSGKSVLAGRTLSITNVATDYDVPQQSFTFSLLDAPEGANLNATNGLFTWRPAIATSGSAYQVRLKVADSGTPMMSATQSFAVSVSQPLSPVFNMIETDSNGVSFHISGDTGPDYVIESTTSLRATNWVPVLITNSPPVPFKWNMAVFTNAPEKFYRIRLGP